MNAEILWYNLLNAMEVVEEQYMFAAPGHQSATNSYIATPTTQHSQTTPSFPEPIDLSLV
jgi:hypothetical protein